MDHTTERSCTAHLNKPPYQGETVRQLSLTYIVLRCVVCNRPQGLRLVRKPQTERESS